MRVCKYALMIALLATSAAVAAQEKPFDGRFYVAPQISYGFFSEDNGLDLENQYGWGGSIGKPITKWFNLEAYYFNFDDIDVKNAASDANLDGYGLTALFFPEHDAIPLYFLVGYAYGNFETLASRVDENAHFIDAGLGYIQPLNDYGVALRGEYRYRSIDVDSSPLNDFEGNFGGHIVSLYLQIPLGAPPPPLPAPSQAAPVAAAAPVQPADGDGDGVPDNRDQCPGTPPGTAVNDQGCPQAKAAPIVLKGVIFEYDSAKLTNQATQRLDNVVNALQASSEIRVHIGGHTDNIGGAAYNQTLSEQRAAAVRQYLSKHGIAESRLTSKGYGETRPVAPNNKPNGADNPAGRAANRRVELKVIK